MIEGIADRLLDELARHREADLMAEFCRDLPLSVICAMLGLPDKDHQRFKNWLAGLNDTENIGAVIRAIPGVLKVVRHLREVARPAGGAKPEGLISALSEAEIEGRKLSEEELVSMIFLLFGAGQETTTHLISGGLLTVKSGRGSNNPMTPLRRPKGYGSCDSESMKPTPLAAGAVESVDGFGGEPQAEFELLFSAPGPL